MDTNDKGNATNIRNSQLIAERTANAAKADKTTRSTRARSQTPTTPTTDAVVDAASALATQLKQTDARTALNALCIAHFDKSATKLFRTLFRSLSFSERDSVLWTRKYSDDGAQITYDLAGLPLVLKRDGGKWSTDGVTVRAIDLSGREHTSRFGASSGSDSLNTATKNALAAWRNAIHWIYTTRETRSESGSASTLAALTEAQTRAANAEKRAAEQEAKQTALEATQAQQTAMIAALLAQVETLVGKTPATEQTEQTEQTA